MEKKKPAQVFHFDLYGKREDKYDFLSNNAMETIAWQTLKPQAPELFFVPKDFEMKESYDKGFLVSDLFLINGVGLTTAHDEFVIKEKKDELLKFYQNFQNSPRDAEYLHKEFNVNKKTGWNILQGYDNIKNEKDLTKFLKPISYRPFDDRFIFYEDKLVWRTVRKIMQHFTKEENSGITLCKQFKSGDTYQHVFITDKIIESSFVSNKTSEITSVFPLYLYPETTTQQSLLNEAVRTPNLNMEIVNEIAKGLGIPFVAEKDLTGFENLSGLPKNVAPIDILDYIYAVLHSPSYREKYKEFLKIDFPRVPYPHHVRTGRDLSVQEIQEKFWELVKLGSQLRQIHLLESSTVEKYITQYPEDGDNIVTKPVYKNGNVYINETQYFANVPEVAWNFYIGGYQPAQKWLKDRKDRELGFEDILHYQKIIVALSETDRIMKEIDKIEI
jgi:predicted helicase